MWSELFFTNAKDFSKQLFTSYTDKEIEYELFNELKSYSYKNYISKFLEHNIEYPNISIEYCSPLDRHQIFIKNSSV